MFRSHIWYLHQVWRKAENFGTQKKYKFGQLLILNDKLGVLNTGWHEVTNPLAQA